MQSVSIEDLLFGTALIKMLQALFAPQFTLIFTAMTDLGSDTILVGIAALIYWCFDKRQGRVLTYVLFIGAYLNFFLKVLIPWPRPPAELRLAEQSETSFGFPSGHVQDSTTVWTWISLNFKRRIFPVLGLVLVTAVGISRIYLGLHYPAQVIGGAAVGLMFVGFAAIIMKRIPYRAGRMQPARQVAFSVLMVLPLVLSIVLLGVSGDAARIGGYLFGFSVGALIEDRYVDFQTNTTLWRRFLRIIIAGLVGGALLGLLTLILQGTDLTSLFLSAMLQGFTIALVIPFVFKSVEGRL